MSKITRTGFALLLLLFLGSSAGNYAAASAKATAAKAQLKQNSPESQPARRSLNESGTGTLQKMIVENGSVTMELDLNRLNGISSVAQRPAELHFAAAANSFFTILVFNDLLRGPEPGSVALFPKVQNVSGLPVPLAGSLRQLVIEKLPSDQAFDLAVRDGKTGFTFFNIVGHQYDYDAEAQLLSITGGNLLVSKEFAHALGRPGDESTVAGKISVGAVMQPIEIQTVVSGETKSVVMPPLHGALGPNTPALLPGPDVIVGDLPQVLQGGNDTVNHFVGLGVGTTSCNNGDQPLDWFALPNTDHPFIPQNLYRMSGGANNNDRLEQIGQSWGKHAFTALEGDACSLGCNTSGCTTGTHLCPGCSDPYSASLNYGQNGIGSRACVNPFTGVFGSDANNHTGHVHTGTSHRVTVASSDLNPAQNSGATYFAEAQYITPHEYSWCQSHPGQCNMYNNASYHQFTVSGSGDSYSFSPVGSTVRMQPAIKAWTNATVSQFEPDPGNDGIFFVGYKVTGPNNGIYHYEYAIYNQNLDRAIQSFEVVYPGFLPILNNVGFHAPPQEPGWLNDCTFNNQGYSSQPWTFMKAFASVTWNCETFVQNQNANAIRYGTLYNFRFDSSSPPATSTANIGFFKTGSPISVQIQAPLGTDTTPTPTPTASATATATSTPTPTPTATATATATSTPTATATATATSTSTPTPTATATATPTPTPTPTPTARPNPAARVRPTPAPRP
jgi:hypothetical protein